MVERTAVLRDLTQHEIQALASRYNMADAHTHQRQSLSQHRLVSALPSLWYEAESTTQAFHERRFVVPMGGRRLPERSCGRRVRPRDVAAVGDRASTSP